MNLAHLPLRVATGAYILNSGLSKQGLEGQAAEGMHGMAANAIPQLKEIPPEKFARLCPRDSLEPRWPDSPPDWSGCISRHQG